MEFPRFLIVVSALGALAGTSVAQPITVRDGADLAVTVKAPVRRVASLVSSSIDIMIVLGAADRIVARTRYDTSSVVAHAADIGGGIDPSVEVIVASRPDLFIAWKGQATAPVVSRMRALGVPIRATYVEGTIFVPAPQIN